MVVGNQCRHKKPEPVSWVFRHSGNAVYKENPSEIEWDHHEGKRFIYSRDEEVSKPRRMEKEQLKLIITE